MMKGRQPLVSDAYLARMLESDDTVVRALAESIRKIRKKQRAYFQRDDVKAKKRAYSQRDDVKAKQRAYFQRDDVKAKQRAYSQRDDVKAKKRDARMGKKVTDYARDVATERGITFEQAMKEIGA